MRESHIESRQNERLKEVARLTNRKYRDQRHLFLIEGCREITHARLAGHPMDQLFYCPDLFPGDAAAALVESIRADPAGVGELIQLSPSAFAKIAYREGPDGLLAVAPQQRLSLRSIHLPPKPLVFILNGIEKPGNLGAILRTADAAGVDLVALVDCVLDLFNPNVIRASQGLFFKVPAVTVDAPALRQWLEELTIPVFGLMPEARETLWEANFRGGAAWLLGAESTGIDPFWRDAAIHPLRIPMAGAADSLNVAATAAICAFEAVRQRLADV